MDNKFSHNIFIIYLRILNHEAPNTLNFQFSQICTTTLKTSPTKKKRKSRTKNKPNILIGTWSKPWCQYLKEHSILPYCIPSRSHQLWRDLYFSILITTSRSSLQCLSVEAVTFLSGWLGWGRNCHWSLLFNSFSTESAVSNTTAIPCPWRSARAQISYLHMVSSESTDRGHPLGRQHQHMSRTQHGLSGNSE